MKPPLVSIVIPSFNSQRYVRDAIHSALTQSYAPTEVIIVDDGSTDGSLDVVRSFGERVTWHASENRGACAARNLGWRSSRGSFIKFLDADDVLLPEVIEAQVTESLRWERDRRTVIYSHVEYMDESGGPLPPRPYVAPREGSDLLLHFLRHNVQTSGPLHRRELLEEIGGFDEDLKIHQEYDLHLRMVASKMRFRYLARPAARVREHRGSHRISNVNLIEREPLSPLRRMQRLVKALEDLSGAPLSALARRELAHRMWRGGRQVLTHGYAEEARRYFEAAQRLSPADHVSGSPLYRSAARLVGVRAAERLGAAVRALRR